MLAWQSIDLRTDPDEPHYPGDPADMIDLATTLEELTHPPTWHRWAACAGKGPEPWFPTRGEDARPAKAVCDACPARVECLSWALEQGDELQGFWAGTSHRERRRLRRLAA